MPEGALALRRIKPEAYPDFSRGYYNRAGLEQAIRHSLDYLAKPSSRRYFPYGRNQSRAGGSISGALSDDSGGNHVAGGIETHIRREFDVYQSVGCDGRGTVYFTGYYCPIFDGRRERDGRVQIPALRLARPDLVKDEEGRTLGAERLTLVSSRTTRSGQMEQAGLLDGLEVAWLRDPFEAYVVTVQGSAKLRLADGSLYELGYAGNNGHEYTPVSAAMVADGVIGRNEISLQTLLKYFASIPTRCSTTAGRMSATCSSSRLRAAPSAASTRR